MCVFTGFKQWPRPLSAKCFDYLATRVRMNFFMVLAETITLQRRKQQANPLSFSPGSRALNANFSYTWSAGSSGLR